MPDSVSEILGVLKEYWKIVSTLVLGTFFAGGGVWKFKNQEDRLTKVEGTLKHKQDKLACDVQRKNCPAFIQLEYGTKQFSRLNDSILRVADQLAYRNDADDKKFDALHNKIDSSHREIMTHLINIKHGEK